MLGGGAAAIPRIVAATLHIGNIEFDATEIDMMDASEIVDEEGAKSVAHCLKVDFDTLNDGLVTRSIVTRGEVTIKQLSDKQAKATAEAFAKGIYGRCFIDIVEFISKILYKPKETESEFRSSIGVLDIFGFENFDINSFEQLCINFCNE